MITTTRLAATHRFPMRAPALEDAVSAAAAPEPPSKTRRKKASHDLQELGEALVALPADRVAALVIEESLRDAVDEYRRTRTHEGRRRQMQYIGKLMRSADVEPIRQAVTDMQLGRAKDALALHEAERWRTELIASDDAITRFIQEHPQVDAQQLRSILRNARKDAAQVPEKRSGRAFRELFQFIRQAALDG
jgi:ribosome-associated protein